MTTSGFDPDVEEQLHDAHLRDRELNIMEPPEDGSRPPRPSRSSWGAVDLRALLDADPADFEPSIGRRDDGQALAYGGKTNGVFSPSEAGKTWLALAWCMEEIRAGHNVVYVDFEDGPLTAIDRLRSLRATDEEIVGRFVYNRPDEPLNAVRRTELVELLAVGPSLVIVDGITEALALHGLNLNDAGDVSRLRDLLFLPIHDAAPGTAVLTLDHTAKDGTDPLGSQHKRSLIDGALYMLEPVAPFGRGTTGRSKLTVSKDRPGRVRPTCLNMKRAGEVVFDGDPDGGLHVTVESPVAGGGTFRPTGIMEKVSRLLALEGALTKNAIRGARLGKAAYVDLAVELLVNGGYVTIDIVGQSHLHRSIRPYREDDERTPE